jgi:N-dimethylarginine dimethylaminohydrolase
MTRQYLMCRPTYFAVDYQINPWMDPDSPVDRSKAIAQWTALVETYRTLGRTVEFIDPVPGLPDMVFAANGATVIDGVVLGVSFAYPERADEAPAYLSWFTRAGFDTHAAKATNEGEGDLLLTSRYLLAGTGFRTELAGHAEAQELFGRPVISLQLVDPRFYHLDTALCVLNTAGVLGPGDGKRPEIAYLPEAFSSGSQRVLEQLFPDAIRVAMADAEVLGLNAVSDGRRVVLPAEASGFARQLTSYGYEPVPVDLSELRKAGGGPKCCTLEVRR